VPLAVFIFAALCASVIVVLLGIPRINGVTLFVAVWVPLVVLASNARVLSPSMTEGTWTILFVAILGIILGTLLGWVWKFADSGEHSRRPAQSVVDIPGLVRFHIATCTVLLLYVVWQTYLVSQKFSGSLFDVYFGGGEEGRLYRISSLDAQELATSSSFSGATLLTGSISNILFLGNISIFSGSVLWVIGKRALAAAPLLLSAAFSTLSVQRTTFLLAVTLFVFAVVGVRRMLPTSERRHGDAPTRQVGKWRKPAATLLLAISILIIVYPQSVRVRGTTDVAGVGSVLPYLLSGVGGLNYRDQTLYRGGVSFDVDPSTTEATPGSNTFTSLFVILQRLDVPVNTAPNFLDYGDIDVLDTTLSTNVGTSFFDYWLDFGLWGVFFIVFGLAVLGALAQRLIWQGKTAAVPVFSFVMTTIFWSFFSNVTLDNYRYVLITVAAMFIIPRFVRTPIGAPGRRSSAVEGVPLSVAE
jgi:oligosaccharide repeat unit polymerase